MSLRDERLARQQERFRNKGGLSKFEKSKSENKLVLNLNHSLIVKTEHVEGRVPPPKSPNSSAVAKVAQVVVTVPATYSRYSLAIPVSNPNPNPSLVPSTDIPKQQATKPNASSSCLRPRKPQPTKKKKFEPAPTKEAYQSDDDELALIVAPAPILAASTRKRKHATAAKPAPTQAQGSPKSVDDRATEMQPVAKKKGRSKPSRAFLKQAEVEEASEPPRPALKRSKPKVAQPAETEDCATEAPSRTRKRKARAEELPAEKPNVSGNAAMSQSGFILSRPVVEDDGDEDEATQGPPKKQRRRVLVHQPCTWDAEDQAPRRVLKLPSHK